jgi:hypothetical protein
VLRAAYPEGLQSTEIRQRARERFNIDLNPNTVGVVLGRYKEKGMARIDGKTWYFVPSVGSEGNDTAPKSTSSGSA